MTAQIPDGAVVITQAQQYAEIQSANRKIDHLTAIIDPALADIRNDVADHETRMRTLERFSWKQIGASSVLATVVSGAVAYLSAH